MANRWAVANGFADDASTWNGGTLPASTDDLYANNFTVSIRANLTANSLKKISGSGITAGGSFVVTAAATVTITAGIAAADNVTNSTSLLTVNAGSASVTITALSITGGAATSRVPLAIDSSYTGTLTVNANITGGSGAGSHAFVIPASCTVLINGTVTNGTNGAAGVSITGASAQVTITGNIAGSANTTNSAVSVAGTSASLTVNGNVSGGSGGGGHGIETLGAGSSTTVVGAVVGGSSATSYGISHTAGALTVRGDIRPGSQVAGSPAINSSSVFRFSGDIYSGGMAASTGPSGFFPIRGQWSAISGEEVEIHVYTDGGYPSAIGGSETILSQYGTDLPDQVDVRDGVTYGASGLLEGSLAVPPAASVAAGVPVDDTVGTAAVKLSDIAAVQGAQIAAATSG